MQQQYVAPERQRSSFNCPHYGAFAHQVWCNAATANGTGVVANLTLSKCTHCNQYSYWHESRMIHPPSVSVPLPSPDMPVDIQMDYLEARCIVQLSPRGAAALLRLCVQRLMPLLGEKGKNIDEDIKSLVAKGLPAKIQMALDAVRVIGNESVHPGQMDLRDEPYTANALFELINLIVRDMITQPKEVESGFASLPAQKLAAIKKRDTP